MNVIGMEEIEEENLCEPWEQVSKLAYEFRRDFLDEVIL